MTNGVCLSSVDENVQRFKYFLQQMSSKNDFEIVSDIMRSGNPPNWTYNPESWSTEIEKIKWSLQEVINKTNTPSDLLLCVINTYLWKFVPPIILLLGTLGNLLSFVVLWNFSGKTVSTFIYLSLLALVDQLVLIFGLLRRWVNHLIANNMEDNISSLCKISQFLGNSLSILSVWLIVAVTLERAIVITFPFKAPSLVKKKRAYTVSIIMAALILLIHSHFVFTVDLVNRQSIHESSVNVTICKFKDKFEHLVSYWLLIDAIIYSFLPLTCIFIFNIIILVKICKAGETRRSLTTSKNSKNAPAGSDSTRQPTIMLLLISGTFLITTTPICIVKMISLLPRLLARNSINRADASVNEIAGYQLADSVAEMLMHLNHAMNFYLYCASGNKFRSCLKSLCRRWFRCPFSSMYRDYEPTQISLYTHPGKQSRHTYQEQPQYKNSDYGHTQRQTNDYQHDDSECEKIKIEELI